MIQELLDKPKGSKKEAFNLKKIQKTIMEKFKKQMLADKRKMQSSLNKDVATIKKCISKMKKSTRLGLLESADEKKKKKCPSDKVVKKCVQKMKKLKPKQRACKTLEKISKKDLDSILELIKKMEQAKSANEGLQT